VSRQPGCAHVANWWRTTDTPDLRTDVVDSPLCPRLSASTSRPTVVHRAVH
jgi:hypothetical protein